MVQLEMSTESFFVLNVFSILDVLWISSWTWTATLQPQYHRRGISKYMTLSDTSPAQGSACKIQRGRASFLDTTGNCCVENNRNTVLGACCIGISLKLLRVMLYWYWYCLTDQLSISSNAVERVKIPNELHLGMLPLPGFQWQRKV